MHTCIHAYIPTCLHTYIHTYIHTTHIFIHADVWETLERCILASATK